MSQDDYSRSQFSVCGQSGRLYITTPTFGVDVNTDRIEAELEIVEDRRGRGRFVGIGSSRRLTLTCDIPAGVNVFFETGASLRRSILDVRDVQRTFLLAPDRRPAPPPERPTWLPGGVWNCGYCGTAQLADLLQCRGCGAPRFGRVR